MITNADVLSGKWKQIRGKIRQRWEAITDKDLAQIEGKADVLIHVLQERYGYSQQNAEWEVNQFLREVTLELESKPERVSAGK